MRVLMVTNTYLPHVGGVATAVDRMTRTLRSMGHVVAIVCPGDRVDQPMELHEGDVIRVAAIKGVGGSEFSFPLATDDQVRQVARQMRAEIIHSHHPFGLGAVGLRVARTLGIPCVYTFHTLYEHYISHFSRPLRHVPISARLAAYTAAYTAAYANPIAYTNKVNAVLVPSRSVGDRLHSMGTRRPIYLTPTGIEDKFSNANGDATRTRFTLPKDAIVVGHVGRLSTEKNLLTTASAMADALEYRPEAYALVVGDGPDRARMHRVFQRRRVLPRVRFTGVLRGDDLVGAFGAMDVFVFASRSETQGLVLAEAMSAGVPVVALDASGARDIVEDGVNGFLVIGGELVLGSVISSYIGLHSARRAQMKLAARETGRSYRLSKTTQQLADVYRQVAAAVPRALGA